MYTQRQQQALEMLRADRRRDIYETQGFNEFCVTYSDGKGPHLTTQEVEDLLKRGIIKLKWPEHPEARCYVLSSRD